VKEEAAMAKAKRGDRVQLHYTGRVRDGREFDSSEHAGDGEWDNFRGRGVAFAPAELVIGSGRMFPSVEEALIGLEPGEKVRVEVPCAKAFGPRNEALVTELPRSEIAPGEGQAEAFRVAEGRRRVNVFKVKVGDVIDLEGPDGEISSARVLALTEETVTLDTNHPLAGQDLVYEVRLVKVL
jgi:peptidylprolyl isomerase